MNRPIAIAVAASLILGPNGSLLAQTRPAPAVVQPLPETRPNPAPETRPVPLPETKPELRPAPSRPFPDNRPNPGGNWQYGGYSAETTCEAKGDRLNLCRVRTENRVTLVNRYRGRCRLDADWGFSSRGIWVRNQCRASFAYGYGNFYPGSDYDYHDDDKGPDAGLIIGGVVVAAGLIALLANKKRKADEAAAASSQTPPTPPVTAGTPAVIDADLSAVAADVRPSLQTCLTEAAKQIGATGGTSIRFDGINKLEKGNGGWRINANVTASYSGSDSTLPMFCRATPTKVIELDFVA